MNMVAKTRRLALISGDAAVMYLSLFITLIIRYGRLFYFQFLTHHLEPFSIVFAVWIVIFYVSGLYDQRRLRNDLDFFKTVGLTLVVGLLIAVFFFYFIPMFGIAPKTNLAIFAIIFTTLEMLWRRFFNSYLMDENSKIRTLIVGDKTELDELKEFIGKTPISGYAVNGYTDKFNDEDILREMIKNKKVGLLIASPKSLKDPEAKKNFYHLLLEGFRIETFDVFFESTLQRIPIADLEESWFVKNSIGGEMFYDRLKRGLEFVLALVVIFLLSPIMLIIALLVSATSRGPIIYSQRRVGLGGKPFVLYKFRTMIKDAEKKGAEWSKPSDPRITFIGRLLRHTHLDELPQLINILRGELSFIGPRPERPEFVVDLEKKIPYYQIRHLVLPGLTGWAQINYRYGSSVEDARIKLEHDIYYLKNRSLLLDIAILIKTLRNLFVSSENA